MATNNYCKCPKPTPIVASGDEGTSYFVCAKCNKPTNYEWDLPEIEKRAKKVKESMATNNWEGEYIRLVVNRESRKYPYGKEREFIKNLLKERDKEWLSCLPPKPYCECVLNFLNNAKAKKLID